MGTGVVFSNTTTMKTSCHPVQAIAEATVIDVPLNEATKEPMEIYVAKDHGRL